jgi:hypothetical protein
MRVNAKTGKTKKIQNPKVPRAESANIQPWFIPSSRIKHALIGAANNSSAIEQSKRI